MKKCNRCKISKPLEDFAGKRKSPDGLQGWCNRCRCDAEKARRRMPGSGDKIRRQGVETQRRHAAKRRARRALQSAIRAGAVTRLDHCQECNATGRIDGHHEDHSKPLEVEWLCTKCHGKRHRKVTA